MKLYKGTAEISVYFLAEDDRAAQALVEKYVKQSIRDDGAELEGEHAARVTDGRQIDPAWRGCLVYGAPKDEDLTVEEALQRSLEEGK